MAIFKKSKNYGLYRGHGPANGLYNVYEITGNRISFWFEKDTANELRKMKAAEFDAACKKLIESSETH